MSKASKEQYLEEIKNGNLKNNAVIILNHIKQNGTKSIADLRGELNFSHQTLTSRLSHLQDCGLLRISGQEKVEELNRHYSLFTFVNDPEEQEAISRERKIEKALKWFEKIEENFKVLGVKNYSIEYNTNSPLFN